MTVDNNPGHQGRAEADPSAQLARVIRGTRFGIPEFREISRVANRDYGIRMLSVEDNLPESQQFWCIVEGEGEEPDTVYVKVKDLAEKSGTYNLGILFHEVIGGHRLFSSTKAVPPKFFSDRPLWFAWEMTEEPAVNDRTFGRFPFSKRLIAETYREDFGFSSPESTQSGVPEMSREQIANFALQPLHIQYVFNMIYRWYRGLDNPGHHPHHPGVTDPRVLELSEKSWDAFQRAISIEISPADSSKASVKAAVDATQKARVDILEREIVPDYLKLVEESKQDYKDRKREEHKKKKQQKSERKDEQQDQSQGSGDQGGNDANEPQEGQSKADEPKPNEPKEGQAQGGGQGKKPEEQDKTDEQLDAEAMAELDAIERDLQNKIKPKLVPITEEELKKLKEQKLAEDAAAEEEVADMQKRLDEMAPVAEPGQVDEREEKERQRRLELYNLIYDIDETQQGIDDFLARADQILTEKKQGLTDNFRRPRDLRSGLEEGDVLDEGLAYRVVGGDNHVFAVVDRNRERQDGMRNYCVTWLIDVSGSQGQDCGGSLSLPDGRKITNLLQGLIIGVESLDRLGVPQQVIAFNAKFTELWGFEDPLDDEAKASIASISDRVAEAPWANYNNDGYALDTATKINQERQIQTGETGLTIYAADGLPAPDVDHSGPEYDLKTVIERIEADRRTDLIGVGIGPGTEHVEDYFRPDDESGIKKVGKHIRFPHNISSDLSELLIQRFFLD